MGKFLLEMPQRLTVDGGAALVALAKDLEHTLGTGWSGHTPTIR